MKPKRIDSALVWQGLSLIDGQSPILAIATGLSGRSTNPKTGPMAQLWILRADMNPLTAVKSQADSAICGDCGLRGLDGAKRGCYVTVAHAPNNIFKTWERGRYATLQPSEVNALLRSNRIGLRLGAYGDPAALPHGVIASLVNGLGHWTGYTHAWRNRPDLAPFVMASADSVDDYEHARALGFRTFRTRLDSQALLPGEIACPASDEMNHRTTCDRCSLCDGSRQLDKRKSIAIIVHGATTVHAVKFLTSKSALTTSIQSALPGKVGAP